jgi:hypothetical protein
MVKAATGWQAAFLTSPVEGVQKRINVDGVVANSA